MTFVHCYFRTLLCKFAELFATNTTKKPCDLVYKLTSNNRYTILTLQIQRQLWYLENFMYTVLSNYLPDNKTLVNKVIYKIKLHTKHCKFSYQTIIIQLHWCTHFNQPESLLGRNATIKTDRNTSRVLTYHLRILSQSLETLWTHCKSLQTVL